MIYWIYILKSISYEKTYVGLTNDLQRRLREHNNGKSIYTNKFKPWRIIYTEEAESLKNARVREKYFKSASGRKKIKNILDNICPRSSAG
jgi:putative endonuclease